MSKLREALDWVRGDYAYDKMEAAITEAEAEIARLRRKMQRLELDRDEALAKVERMDAALAEYECDCTGFCQAENFGGPCGRLAVAARAARKEPTDDAT